MYYLVVFYDRSNKIFNFSIRKSKLSTFDCIRTLVSSDCLIRHIFDFSSEEECEFFAKHLDFSSFVL